MVAAAVHRPSGITNELYTSLFWSYTNRPKETHAIILLGRASTSIRHTGDQLSLFWFINFERVLLWPFWSFRLL